jgi:hypothetical protein
MKLCIYKYTKVFSSDNIYYLNSDNIYYLILKPEHYLTILRFHYILGNHKIS